MAYDDLCCRHSPAKAVREYLRILQLAARVNETGVDNWLGSLLNNGEPVCADMVKKKLRQEGAPKKVTDVEINEVCLDGYDQLLEVAI